MRAILVVTLISIALLSACTKELDRVYAEAKQCAESIYRGGDCPPQQKQNSNQERTPVTVDTGRQDAVSEGGPTRNAALGESRVYIDASESMKGFAAAADNSFVPVIEALGYAMPGCRLYKYGSSGGRKVAAVESGQLSFAQEIRFSQELRRPAFYDLAFNEDDVLIKHLAQEATAARSVLLTDGVYSARNTELQSEVVKAIEQWIDKGRFFGILIFTSAFDGRLYSENNRAWTEPVKVSARPFYAFIFSSTEKEFRELREQLQSEVKIVGSLAFPREAVSCTVMPEDKDGLEKKDVPPRNPFYLQMYNASLFAGKNQAEMFFDLRCTPSSDYPVAAFKPEPLLDSYTWQQNSFRKKERPPQVEYKYAEDQAAAMPSPSPTASGEGIGAATPSQTPNARRQPNLKLILKRDGEASYSLYHLTFNLSGRALRSGIRDLSSQDDGLIGEAGKTYRFYEFISSLTTMHLQNSKAMVMPHPVFIAIANK